MKGLLLAVVVLALSGTAGAATREARLSDAASVIAEKPVSVLCYTAEEWAAGPRPDAVAYVLSRDRGTVHLSVRVCRYLRLLNAKTTYPRDNQTRLVLASVALTLAHELGHARGLANENDAECFGMKRVGTLLVLLKVPRPVTRELVRLAITVVHEAKRWDYRMGC